MNIHLRLANYISRYAPSHAKICEYLAKKNIQNPDAILAEIGYNEDLMLDAWMRTFINTGKWKRDIENKLRLKKFPKEKILVKIVDFADEIEDWQNIRPNLIRWLENRLEKGKSRKILEMELFGKYPYFKDEISELLALYSDETGLTKEIEKYAKKYNLSDKNEKQKFFQALMRKWFRYDEIKRKLEENDE